MSDSFEPRIVGFLCNWCSYAGADMTGTSRIPYPANIRIVRVPCSGRVDPLYVLKAFQEGADGVLVAGCHPGDCHYGDGNYHARRRYALMHRFLDFVGIEAGRLHIDWVSAAEGNRFAQVVSELTEQVRALGPWTGLRESEGQASPGTTPPRGPAGPAPGGMAPASGGTAGDAASVQSGIRLRARELLSLGEVGCVVGYERSPKGRIRPTFIYDPADTDRLVWDQTCHHNLVVYLHDKVTPARRGDRPPRVAVVARPCDVRALNVLIHEGQIAREQVFVIGVACPGMLETGNPGSPAAEESGFLAEQCRRCKERVPVFYDALVGEPPKGKAEEETWADVAEVEAMTPAERLAFWTAEFERCIRCYACRQACPGCYCFECVIEQVDPAWASIAHRVPEKAFFHVMRAYHLAGRCVECHACDQACPMHIPLSLLNRKIAREVQALFGYVAGGDPAIPPPLATFRKDEELPL